ncbi:DUF4244 domain-containing protein [Aeromicrobium phragmitis]|uniref:DUF4244 domain-containing protein n=1 Tax=Aeromicrobium phragmitis TaxID=2478914 RepID=A0A3L8PSW9_9ACTN|nr:DUF4244 domain-containing protein [Aeromicrobium phragmitis]RLV57518.1 DUF4244 domain-containing protein [Aeromicrobium phragmitis]
MMRKTFWRRHETGMSTAEYAVGTLGTATIAAVLIGPGNPIMQWVQAVFEKVLTSILTMDPDSFVSLPEAFVRAVESLWPW